MRGKAGERRQRTNIRAMKRQRLQNETYNDNYTLMTAEFRKEYADSKVASKKMNR
jgi:hypothetical protein